MAGAADSVPASSSTARGSSVGAGSSLTDLGKGGRRSGAAAAIEVCALA